MTFGLSTEDFWRLSLRELWNVRKAAQLRQTDELERDAILAWQIERVAILSLAKQGERRLPELQRVLGKKRPAQTHGELADAMKQLSVLYKLPLEIRKAN